MIYWVVGWAWIPETRRPVGVRRVEKSVLRLTTPDNRWRGILIRGFPESGVERSWDQSLIFEDRVAAQKAADHLDAAEVTIQFRDFKKTKADMMRILRDQRDASKDIWLHRSKAESLFKKGLLARCEMGFLATEKTPVLENEGRYE